MVANEANSVGMAVLHQPNTPITQILCLFPYSMRQGCQLWWDITDRKPGMQDFYLHKASQMATNEAVMKLKA